LQKFLNSKQQGRLDGFFTVKPKEKAPLAKGKGKTLKADNTKGKGTKRKVRYFPTLTAVVYGLTMVKQGAGDDKGESSGKKAKTKK
jgi:hypothetical protein